MKKIETNTIKKSTQKTIETGTRLAFPDVFFTGLLVFWALVFRTAIYQWYGKERKGSIIK